MSVVSPLTGSAKTELVETVRTKDLVRLYRRTLGCDVSTEFIGVEEIGFYRCVESDLCFFDPAVAGSSKFYDELQKFDWYYLESKREYEDASKFVDPRGTVLEVGCGSGNFAKRIGAKHYTGLEISDAAVQKAQNEGVTVLQEGVETHAATSPGNYDVVCGFQVLEHVKNVSAFIEACVRCVRPGGIVIFSVPSADSFLALAPNNCLNLPPHHLTWWSDDALRFVAKRFSLEVQLITHENLADIHVRWYTQIMCMEALRALTGYRRRTMVDLSWRCRAMSALARLGGKLLERGLREPRMRAYGHSVTAVFRKKR